MLCVVSSEKYIEYSIDYLLDMISGKAYVLAPRVYIH